MQRVLGLTVVMIAILGGIALALRWEREQRVRAANSELRRLLLVHANGFGLGAAVPSGPSLQGLLRRGASPTAVRAEDGTTVLMYAASHGDLDSVEFCLRAGADVNERDEVGGTALMAGCYSGYPEVLKRLLAAGADVHATTRSWRSSRQVVAQGGTALHFAARAGDSRMVQVLLAVGADVYARDEFGTTPLMEVADCLRPNEESVAAAKLLREHGARLELKNKSGHTALALARNRPHRLLVEYLSGK